MTCDSHLDPEFILQPNPSNNYYMPGSSWAWMIQEGEAGDVGRAEAITLGRQAVKSQGARGEALPAARWPCPMGPFSGIDQNGPQSFKCPGTF